MIVRKKEVVGRGFPGEHIYIEVIIIVEMNIDDLACFRYPQLNPTKVSYYAQYF